MTTTTTLEDFSNTCETGLAGVYYYYNNYYDVEARVLPKKSTDFLSRAHTSGAEPFYY